MSFKIRTHGAQPGTFLAGLALATAGSLLFTSNALGQDNCDTAVPPVIGLNAFNLGEMTTSGFSAPCFKGDVVHHDVWYCFESPVDGWVNISTCGLTNVDTRIVLWPGCVVSLGRGRAARETCQP